jgi:hypothetical protein
MSPSRFALPLFTLLAAAGCASIRTTTTSAIRTALHADRVTLSPGEAVRFVAKARNPTMERILLTETCGPALDVLVTQPGGVSQSVQGAAMGTTADAHSSADCKGHHAQIVEPGDSSIVTLRWVAPALRGEYLARAGLRGPGGFSHLSDPVRLVVE